MEKTTCQELKRGSQRTVGIGEALLDKMAIKLGLNSEKVVGKRTPAEKETCKRVKHDQVPQVRQSNMCNGDYNCFYITKTCFNSLFLMAFKDTVSRNCISFIVNS